MFKSKEQKYHNSKAQIESEFGVFYFILYGFVFGMIIWFQKGQVSISILQRPIISYYYWSLEKKFSGVVSNMLETQ